MVDDEHQGRGLATVLLEYLAVAARENGLDGLTATVLPTNRKMLGVFHDVGFQVVEHRSTRASSRCGSASSPPPTPAVSSSGASTCRRRRRSAACSRPARSR